MIKLVPEERSAFLDKACGDDELIRREVEQLLKADDPHQSKTRKNIPPAYSRPDEKQDPDSTQILSKNQNSAQFGDYEIISRIGKGGMGEVYLARDPGLGREVAIKVLPEHLTNHKDYLRRFEQEARAASALNHPYILTIFEFGKNAQGRHFIVTEYVKGKTLNEFCVEEDNDLSKKLDVLIRIAAALAAAHEAGIIHRDIKPENIIVRPDGYVKVLDFGLAKLVKGAQPDNPNSRATTHPWIETIPGMIMGTAGYMSPEQAKGKPVDARTDIFSFGILLYETVTGNLPFNGSSLMEIVAAILHEEPQPISDPALLPELKGIISKSLQKDPNDRYQTMNDLLADLKDARRELDFQNKPEKTLEPDKQETAIRANPETLRELSGGSNRQTSGNFLSKRWFNAPAALAVMLLTVSGFLIWRYATEGLNRPETGSSQNLNTFKTYKITDWANAAGELSSTAAFSPDGKFVAFGSTKTGTTGIWVKQTNSGDAIQITKNDFYNRFPVWSADGEEVAYYSNRGGAHGLWRGSLMGGQQKLIAENIDVESKPKLWSKSGRIYFQGRFDLFAADVKTGEVEKITDFGSAGEFAKIIEISPDEKHIAFLIFEDGRWRIKTKPLDGDETRQIFESENLISDLVWHPDGGRILFSLKTEEFYQIFTIGLDSGEAVQLSSGDADSFVQDVSPDGERVLFTSATETSDLWKLDVDDGKEKLIASEIDAELWANASPDSGTVVYQSIKNLRQGSNLFNGSLILQPVSNEARPLELVENGCLPEWSPDGKTIAFTKLIGQQLEIWRVGSNGEQLQRLASGNIQSPDYSLSPYLRSQVQHISWSPDGSALAFSAVTDGVSNIRLVPVGGGGVETNVSANTDKNISVSGPIWSPAGTSIAYVSRPRKPDEINRYAVETADTVTKQTARIYESSEVVRLLGWSENGDELIFAARKESKNFTMTPPETPILAASVKNSRERLLTTLENAYFYNIFLSPDRKKIAFTSRTSGNDDVWTVSLEGGEARKLTENNDPRLYFSSLTWTPNGKSILFGKQTRFTLLSMLIIPKITEKKNENTAE